MYYTVYGSICTFILHFSTHLCTVYCLRFNMYIYLHFSTHLCTVYNIWFNMYIYLALLYTSMYNVLFTVQYVHLFCIFLHIYVQCTVYGSICTYTCTSLHIYVRCTVYGSIFTFTWHFSTHLCTLYSIWLNMYINLTLLYTSMYRYSTWFNMYINLAFLYTSMYSVQYMVQYVHLPGPSLHIYVQCTVYGSICTFT